MIEGETFLFLAGLAAHQGVLALEWVLPLAWAGAAIGDQIPFFLGRFKGRDFLHRRPTLLGKCSKVLSWMTRHRLKVFLFYRFMYGFRGIAPFVFGLTGMRAGRFVTASLIVGLIWTMTVGLAGYYLGGMIETLGIKFKSVQYAIAAGLMAGLAVFIVLKLRAWNENEKKK